ncbi:hypothetical protein DSCA_40060 [Desulfosarcina alkanivorans]|uniref:YbaK/aminoacyl-tRNA synthetase-associated domain-containing protein n=1 Tax=Desulfosarcina alkanivorans TaxID=571177 RepID=A0A5K7YLH8_9BACT|nr:YbaK/EbsC family protein [Desulfosarcina alkanivorans]BBO70076.1 hypothetical protein DSCA_40060 [Desulfosarcina alkanivorans]
MVYPTVIEMLEQSGAAFHIHDHVPVTTMDEATAKVPHLTHDLIKTVVFRIRHADWILAAVKGGDRIHYKKLAAALAVKRTDLRSIAPDQVESGLGFEVGGVGPFPVRSDIRIVFDEALRHAGTVFCGSGKNTQTVEIKMADLMALSGGRVYPITKPGR